MLCSLPRYHKEVVESEALKTDTLGNVTFGVGKTLLGHVRCVCGVTKQLL